MQSEYRGSVKDSFPVKMGFFNLATGCGSSVRLLPASYCLLYLLLLGCCRVAVYKGEQEGNSHPDRSQQEECI
jgi:hypothetical protein